MPRSFRLVLVVVAALVSLVVAWAIAATLLWYIPFRERMRLAEDHAAVVKRVLSGDGRFANLQADSYTGHGGTLLITGDVQHGSTADLKRLVEATEPPVAVDYEVNELEP